MRIKLRNKKTGKVADLLGMKIEGGTIWMNIEVYGEEPKAYDYDSLAELNEEWEDYTPAESLIKDEKIRKTVRAWAEANDTEDGITYLGDGEFRSYMNTTIDFVILVNEHRFDLLKKSEDYTVTELCGEDE